MFEVEDHLEAQNKLQSQFRTKNKKYFRGANKKYKYSNKSNKSSRVCNNNSNNQNRKQRQNHKTKEYAEAVKEGLQNYNKSKDKNRSKQNKINSMKVRNSKLNNKSQKLHYNLCKSLPKEGEKRITIIID